MAGRWFPSCICSASYSLQLPQPTRASPSSTSSAAQPPSSRSPSWPYLVSRARPLLHFNSCYNVCSHTLCSCGCLPSELNLVDMSYLLDKIFLIFPNYCLGMSFSEFYQNYEVITFCTSSAFAEYICKYYSECLIITLKNHLTLKSWAHAGSVGRYRTETSADLNQCRISIPLCWPHFFVINTI